MTPAPTTSHGRECATIGASSKRTGSKSAPRTTTCRSSIITFRWPISRISSERISLEQNRSVVGWAKSPATACPRGQPRLRDFAHAESAKEARLPTLHDRQPAHDQPVQPGGKCRRIVRDLAIEDLSLIEQQCREVSQILVARCGLGLRHGLDQGMTHVELEDRLGACGPPLPGQESIELAIRAMTARHQAGGTV